MKKLICMAYDGDYHTEREGTKEECCYASANLGSKWIFFPFHFILSDSGKTVIDTGQELEFMKGKRLKTAIKMFERLDNFITGEADENTPLATCDDWIICLKLMNDSPHWKEHVKYYFDM